MGETLTLEPVGTLFHDRTSIVVPFITQSEEVRQYAARIELETSPQDDSIEQVISEQAADLIGRAAVGEVVSNSMTLKEAIVRAEQGDQEALKLVTSNVQTDYLERAYKSGHVIRVVLGVDAQGKLSQHGQTMEEVNINSLSHIKSESLNDRVKIEARNAVRQQHYFEKGLLKDNALITWSTVLDNVSRQEAKRLGYFIETMSCAIQMVTEEEGEVVLYSAFVAGSDSKDGERFDLDAVRASAAEFGIDYSGLNSNEILARPGLVPKKLLPDGVLNVVEKYDQNIAGQKNRFFGRVHEGERDYRAHMLECRRREEEAEVRTKKVVNQLLSASHTFKSPADATKLLDELNDLQLKAAITKDKSIDTNVLGYAAEQYVIEARYHFARGNEHQLIESQKMMMHLGVSSSCPADMNESMGDLETSNILDGKQEKLLDCDFISKKCPQCGEENVMTKCRNGKYYGACGCVSK